MVPACVVAAAGAQPRKKTISEQYRSKRKLKTHAGAKKRFKLRGDGRWVYTMTGRNHLLAGSSRSRQTLKKRKKKAISAKAIQKTMHLLQPYARRRAVPRA